MRFVPLLLGIVGYPPLFAATLDQSRLAGNGRVSILALAATREGGVLAAGSTTAFDLPVRNALQERNSGSALMVSPDGGRAWRPLGFVPDLPFTALHAPAVHPGDPNLLLTTGISGIYRSADGGETWQTVLDLKQRPERERIGYIDALLFDPRNPSTVYVSSTAGLLISTDTGRTWTLRSAGLEPGSCCTGTDVDLDGSRILLTINDRLYVSAGGGGTWSRIRLPFTNERAFVEPDPFREGTWYVRSYRSIYRTIDRGATWTTLDLDLGPAGAGFVLADPHTPGTLYTAPTASGLRISTDRGETWRSLPAPSGITHLRAHPQRPGTLAAVGSTGTFVSSDGGHSWQPAPIARSFWETSWHRHSADVLYASGPPTADGFLLKRDARGETIFYTYWGGFGYDSVTAVSEGRDGDIWIAGETQGMTAPAPVQGAYLARLDASGRFLSLISLAGRPTALTVNAEGTVFVAGDLSSQGYVTAASPDGRRLWNAGPQGFVTALAPDTEGGVWAAGSLFDDTAIRPLIHFDANGNRRDPARLPVAVSLVAAGPQGGLITAGVAATSDTPPAPVSPAAFQQAIDNACPHNSGGLFSRPPLDRPRWMTDLWLGHLTAEGTLSAATLFGGSCRETLTALTVGADGSISVAGLAYSGNLPLRDPLFGPPPAGTARPFVARLDPGGQNLLFSTFLDYGDNPRLAVAPTGTIYASGNTPERSATPDAERSAFLIRIDPAADRPALLLRSLSAGVSPHAWLRLDVPELNPAAPIDLGIFPENGLPTELAGVRVEFDGAPAPIGAIAAGGIDVIAPASLRGKTQTRIQVIAEGRRSNALLEAVRPRTPRFYAIGNEDGSGNGPQSPAEPGSWVRIYFTGAGLTDTPVPDGALTPAISPTVEVRWQLALSGRLWETQSITGLRAVPGFLSGLWEARIPVPAVSGSYQLTLHDDEAAHEYPAVPPVATLYVR